MKYWPTACCFCFYFFKNLLQHYFPEFSMSFSAVNIYPKAVLVLLVSQTNKNKMLYTVIYICYNNLVPFVVKIIFVIVQALFKTVHRSLVLSMLPVTTLCFVYHNN